MFHWRRTFDEWKHFSPFQAVMFPIGIAVTVRGVVELTKRGDEEDELDESFRDQIFDALKSGYLKLRTAVADRNE